MKIVKVKESGVLQRKALQNPVLFGNREGKPSRGRAEYAIIDNLEREANNAVLLDEEQLIDILSTIPATLYKKLIVEGVLVISGEEVILNSPVEQRKQALIDLGVDKDLVWRLKDKEVQRCIVDIKAEILFVEEGQLVTKAQKELDERASIIAEATKVGIIDAQTLGLDNMRLRGAIELKIKANKANDKERTKLLEDLKDYMNEENYNDSVDLSTESLKDLLSKSKEFFKAKVKSLKQEIEATDFVKVATIAKPKTYNELVALEKEFTEYKHALVIKASEKLEGEEKTEEEEVELPTLSVEQMNVISAKQEDAIKVAEEVVKQLETPEQEK